MSESPLVQLVLGTLEQNQLIGKGQNNNGVFFCYFDSRQQETMLAAAVTAAKASQREAIVIDAGDKGIKEIAHMIGGLYSNPLNESDAYYKIEDYINNNGDILVFTGISSSKIKNKSGFIRSLLKILDDGHFKNIQPKGDLVFVDTASFLDKNWDELNAYIFTNIVE